MLSSSYVISSWLFVRGLGFVYLVAFCSFYAQFDGLYGPNGLLPLSNTTSHPGLFQLSSPMAVVSGEVPPIVFPPPGGVPVDGWVHLVCLCSIGMSFLVLIGYSNGWMMAMLWIAYLSLFKIGQVFLGFQWDLLLIETGFLAIFIVPLFSFKSKVYLSQANFNNPVYFLYRWLFFRLLFASGIVKLNSNCPAWWSLTAMQYHYWTTCLPSPLSWYAHNLSPDWIHQFSTVFTFVVELIVPFWVFLPFSRSLRLLTAVLSIIFQIGIELTGNYTFFNILTAILAIPLLDDQFLLNFLPKRSFLTIQVIDGQKHERKQKHENKQKDDKKEKQENQQKHDNQRPDKKQKNENQQKHENKQGHDKKHKHENQQKHDNQRPDRKQKNPQQDLKTKENRYNGWRILDYLILLMVFTISIYLTITYFSIHLEYDNIKSTYIIKSKIAFSKEQWKNFVDWIVPISVQVGRISLILFVLPNIYYFQDQKPSKKSCKWLKMSYLFISFLVLLSITIFMFEFSSITYSKGLGMKSDEFPLVSNVHSKIQHWHLSTSYGLFARMTTTRPEIIILGSMDGTNWLEYEFKHKSGNVSRAPVYVAPYQPRLDWQMWFAALGSYQHNPWLIHLLIKLLQPNQHDVFNLLEKLPFPTDKPPKFIKADLYQYKFTKPMGSGGYPKNWWTRTYQSEYIPVITRTTPSLKTIAEQFHWSTNFSGPQEIPYDPFWTPLKSLQPILSEQMVPFITTTIFIFITSLYFCKGHPST